MTYNVVLVSDIQHNDSVIHRFILFQFLFSYRLSQNIEYSSLCYTVGSSCYLSYIQWCLYVIPMESFFKNAIDVFVLFLKEEL